MEHDIPFGNSSRENGNTFLDFSLSLGIFQWEEPTKRVPFTAEPEIPEILTINGKRPMFPLDVSLMQIKQGQSFSIDSFLNVFTFLMALST